jgi:hypothetical protein
LFLFYRELFLCDDHYVWQGDIEGNIRIVRGTLGSEAGKDTEALNGLGAVRASAPVVPGTQCSSRLAFVALATGRHDWLSRRGDDHWHWQGPIKQSKEPRTRAPLVTTKSMSYFHNKAADHGTVSHDDNGIIMI